MPSCLGQEGRVPTRNFPARAAVRRPCPSPPAVTMPDGILLLYAHPDDESFMAAGTVATYRARGVRVALVCATTGQGGSTGDPPLASSREELGVVREAELRAA